MLDMKELQGALEKAERGEGSIPPKLLEIFENVAYIMARHANPDMPEKSVEDWLDRFEAFSIYEVFPQLVELWQLNTYPMVESKKKPGR